MDATTIDIQARRITTIASEGIRERLREFGFARVTGVQSGFRYEEALVRFGEPIPQYGGQLVRDVKPDQTLKPEEYSALSMDELIPHTEWYEFPGIPPRYVALWYVRTARGAGGETTLADGHQLLKRFSEAELAQMRERLYEWYGAPVKGSDRSPVSRPILEEHANELIMHYTSRYVRPLDDDLIQRYIDRGLDFFRSEHVAVPADDGDILIWDNWRMMHARNSFTDPNRHLRRMLLAQT